MIWAEGLLVSVKLAGPCHVVPVSCRVARSVSRRAGLSVILAQSLGPAHVSCRGLSVVSSRAPGSGNATRQLGVVSSRYFVSRYSSRQDGVVSCRDSGLGNTTRYAGTQHTSLGTSSIIALLLLGLFHSFHMGPQLYEYHILAHETLV